MKLPPLSVALCPLFDLFCGGISYQHRTSRSSKSSLQTPSTQSGTSCTSLPCRFGIVMSAPASSNLPFKICKHVHRASAFQLQSLRLVGFVQGTPWAPLCSPAPLRRQVVCPHVLWACRGARHGPKERLICRQWLGSETHIICHQHLILPVLAEWAWTFRLLDPVQWPSRWRPWESQSGFLGHRWGASALGLAFYGRWPRSFESKLGLAD